MQRHKPRFFPSFVEGNRYETAEGETRLGLPCSPVDGGEWCIYRSGSAFWYVGHMPTGCGGWRSNGAKNAGFRSRSIAEDLARRLYALAGPIPTDDVAAVRKKEVGDACRAAIAAAHDKDEAESENARHSIAMKFPWRPIAPGWACCVAVYRPRKGFDWRPFAILTARTPDSLASKIRVHLTGAKGIAVICVVGRTLASAKRSVTTQAGVRLRKTLDAADAVKDAGAGAA